MPKAPKQQRDRRPTEEPIARRRTAQLVRGIESSD